MKRSEMLTQIKDELHHELWGYLAENSEHDDAVTDAGIDLDDLAEKVLVRIEQAGMLPPPTKNKKESISVKMADGVEFITGASVREWEQEDED